MNRDSARDYINQQAPTFLQAAQKKGYICPTCGQGSTKGNGITKDRTGHYKCFDCGLYADVIELYGLSRGIGDYNAQLQEAAAYYGITVDHRSTAREDFTPMYQNQPKTEQYTHSSIHTDTQDFTELYREAAAHLQETDYHTRRGLSAETCRRFNIGFLPAWKHPKAPKAPASPRLIIPVSAYSYIARDTRQEIPAGQEDYKKSKVKGQERVSWTFNAEALQTAQKPVYIVEGEIDALSIIETGGEAVAIGSTSNTDRFLKELGERKPAQPLIIALDNDKAGQEAAEKLQAGLDALTIPYYRYNPAGDKKDANELLTADRAALEALVAQGEELTAQEAAEKLQDRKDAYLQNSAAAHLQDFINGIAESVNTPTISTGFPKLDAVLDGGLYEGLYTCGAISSLGKTTFCLQIADHIAQQGHDVLIFSLEMARTQLMAKSISRHTMLEVLETGGNISNAKTSRGITTGARYANYNPTERELIQTAIQRYNSYAGHIFITEGMGDIGTTQIRETVQEHILITGRTPVVLVDYLQILAPADVRATDKQNTDKSILELKRISRDYKTPVIAISSFNRENYSATVSMQAFKESGAVEYSSDVLIGLQLAGAGEKNFDVDKAKRDNPRKVELVILKNREAQTGDKVDFRYYAMFNCFEEA